jgi:ATP-dependent helicase HrpA
VPAPPRQPFRFRLEFPPELPISVRAEELVATIQANPVVILAGETGSGKTTQIPKMCLAAGRGVAGRIACTQPRRVAALSVSRRVAEELGVAWGREVGCKIRFNDQTTSATVIKFLTDGMLLAEVQGDPLLREYDTIIIDEAHERSLNIDFLLGHLRTLRFKRPELKIIITSATIDTEMFSRAFDDAPVVQVSGRTFPVEVIYSPLDALGSDEAEGDERTAKAEALHYIDGAVEAVERIIHESADGDILVFMPSERDIRETADLLEGRLRHKGRPVELVPLFGRLTNAEQQRVFAATQARKIIVATNIAETSLTIPGIRFVVDTGLARISRYAAQARTRRLPIESIAQSSADQRKGRSGRVADGVCIRLYSEKDFLERPRFTQPEIQRANLADVILRLKAFGLGDIERFPFINMPAAKSIRAGYALLEELGAIEDVGDAAPSPRLEAGEGARPPFAHELTPVGRELARLPVDPTVGRMILQARTEKALREVLVIAAGLSIQDPRERPLEKQAAADAAHRRFMHPDSDFLTLFNIWETYHEEFENLSQAKLRRFCRDHFLSYTRMREWRDIHAQLAEVVRERGEKKLSSAFDGLKEVDAKAMAFGTPPYRAIHRSILAGLLGNIAQLDEEKGGYKATHDRRVNLFPGSVLFRREEPKRRGPDDRQRPALKKDAKSPRWLMAAEIMETTRLYARTCARLDPAWALELGAHIVRTAYSEPFWDTEKARVLVKRRSRLYGLELELRAVSFGRVNPVQATEIFIREALVNDTLTWPFDFLAHNRAVRREVESLLTRSRDRGYLNLDETVFRFYAARLMPEGRARSPSGPERKADMAGRPEVGPYQGISSVAELVDLVRERKAAEPHFLEMTPEDLRAEEMPMPDAAAFPADLPLDNRALPLNYAYKPGGPEDGVTLDVRVREAEALTAAALDWAVPGHLEAKVEHYLRALPKELRRAFVPLAATASQVAARLMQRDRLLGRRETLIEALVAELRESHRVAIDPALWTEKPLPDFLRVRVRVLDDEDRELATSRELKEVHAVLARHRQEASAAVAREEPAAWRRARAQWEKADQTDWTFGDVPAQVQVAEQAGVPALAFPGLVAGAQGVSLRLCKTREEAQAATRGGLTALLALQLRYELGWLERDLKALRELGPLLATLAPVATLQEQALQSIRHWVCDPARCRAGFPNPTVSGAIAERRGSETPPYMLKAATFVAALSGAKADLRGLVPRLVDLLREMLELRQTLLVHPQPYEGLEEEIAALVPADFLARTPFPQLAHFPRYLKGMKLRADRWRQHPAKDAERARTVARYVQALARPGAAGLRWMVEEFRVSLFAQELGTAEPVSAVKLDRLFAETGAAPARPAAEPTPVRPLTKAPAGKSSPLKSLGALDRLFKK